VPNLVPVSQTAHAHKVWRRPPDFRFAAKEAVVAIVAWEFGHVAPWMPIVFIEQGGALVPMAMMSPIPGRNLFVGPQGQWLGGYVPAVLRTHPFRRARVQGREEAIVCFDQDSGLLAEEGGEDFFAANGEPSAALRPIVELLQAMSAAQNQAELAMASLAEAGVIEPWPLQVQIRNSTGSAVAGLHRINEAALNALDDAGFLKLRKTGALVLAYMQLVSMRQTARFDTLFRLYQEPALSVATALKSRETLDELFSLSSDDTIRFN
jgi:SapC